eukprot:scaffold34493_cov46-Phaeocystis_antarctica.AAC.1
MAQSQLVFAIGLEGQTESRVLIEVREGDAKLGDELGSRARERATMLIDGICEVRSSGRTA